MSMAKYSPTVINWYGTPHHDTDGKDVLEWFHLNGGGLNNGQDSFSFNDDDGYNQYGYNSNGMDRANYSQSTYKQHPNLYNQTRDNRKNTPLPHITNKLTVWDVIFTPKYTALIHDSDNNIVKYQDNDRSCTIHHINPHHKTIQCTSKFSINTQVVDKHHLKCMPAKYLKIFKCMEP